VPQSAQPRRREHGARVSGTSFTPVTEVLAGLAGLAGRARRRRACAARRPLTPAARPRPPLLSPRARRGGPHHAPAQTAPAAPSRAGPRPRAENARRGGRAAPGIGHLGGLVARGPQREVVPQQLEDLRRLLVLRRIELRARASAARPRTRWVDAGGVCVCARACVWSGDAPPRDRRSRPRKPSCSRSTPPRRPPGSRRRKPAAQTVPPSAASRSPLPTRRGAGARGARAGGTGVAHRLVEGEAEAEGGGGGEGGGGLLGLPPTRRVQLVRGDGRDVSTLYGREGGGGRPGTAGAQPAPVSRRIGPPRPVEARAPPRTYPPRALKALPRPPRCCRQGRGGRHPACAARGRSMGGRLQRARSLKDAACPISTG